MKSKYMYFLSILLLLCIICISPVYAAEKIDIEGHATWNDSKNTSLRPRSIEVELYANNTLVDKKIVSGSVTDNVNRYYTSRHVIKEMNSTFDNKYSYVSFSSGIYFNKKELYASRAANQHTTSTNSSEWGKIVFFERTANGINKVYPDIPYSQFSGELRDPTLSKINDNLFFLSCFTTDASNNHTSVLMTLDKNYNVTSSIVSSDSLFWGNTLITPEGYILKAGYIDGSIKLYRSNKKFENTLSGISLTKIKEFTVSGNSFTEPTIGYYNDELILIARNGTSSDPKNSYIFKTSNLEGNGTWDSGSDLGIVLHSPVLLQEYHGTKLLFAGSYIADPVNNKTLRVPCIGYINTSTGKKTSIDVIDSSVTGFSGYPALVKHNGGYGMIYYENDNSSNAKTALYLKDISSNYDTENLYSSGWKWVFPDKDKNKDGQAIKYTIKMKPIENYTTEINNYNIVNTLIEEESDTVVPDDTPKPTPTPTSKTEQREIVKVPDTFKGVSYLNFILFCIFTPVGIVIILKNINQQKDN